MTSRFNLYFPAGTEYLLEEAKEKIPNLSEFLLQAIRDRLSAETAEKPAEKVSAEALFQKKFGDLESEAYVRKIFEDRNLAEQALKNRLIELRRTNREQFGETLRLFAEKYPGYAKILDEL